jgi:sugar-specific transcriptional regulator TrmB
VFKEHGEKILREMGLTHSQAKLYVALVRMHACTTANALSKSSNVARQDVYRILEELQSLGLVEKIIANPTLFKAIPIGEATSTLMEKRREKTRILLKETAELLGEFPEENLPALQESHQFVLIPQGDPIVRKIEEAIKTAKKKIMVITPWRELTQWMLKLNQSWKQAVERGVKVHWITESKPQNLDSNLEIARDFLGNPNFNLRILPQPLPMTRLGIYDHREVFISITRNQNTAESPALWTNNPTIVYMLTDYFEMKWKLAQECNIHEY